MYKGEYSPIYYYFSIIIISLFTRPLFITYFIPFAFIFLYSSVYFSYPSGTFSNAFLVLSIFSSSTIFAFVHSRFHLEFFLHLLFFILSILYFIYNFFYFFYFLYIHIFSYYYLHFNYLLYYILNHLSQYIHYYLIIFHLIYLAYYYLLFCGYTFLFKTLI